MLELEGLEIDSTVHLVDRLSLDLKPGRVTALVGESGSGKSISTLAVMGLLPDGLTARWRRYALDGQLIGDREQLARLRGRTIALMPQDANAALDPIMRVADQLDEVLGPGVSAAAALREVGFSDDRVARAYPHQLSGGMAQRVLLALTLAPGPRVLIVDEPTSALDASLRQSVLSLLRRLVDGRGLALWLITHDLLAAQAIADELLVFYAGQVVERGPTSSVLRSPRHPFTMALLAASRGQATRVSTVRGAGCRFSPRCSRADAACSFEPPLGDRVACHHPLEPT